MLYSSPRASLGMIDRMSLVISVLKILTHSTTMLAFGSLTIGTPDVGEGANVAFSVLKKSICHNFCHFNVLITNVPCRI